METRLYTLHTHRKRTDIRVVGEGSWLTVIPPLWALLEGYWLTALGMVGLMILALALHPLGMPFVYAALACIAYGDGGTLGRLELRLRGWREVGAVEARSPEGAEELFVKGETA